jgi:hypothetical protein
MKQLCLLIMFLCSLYRLEAQELSYHAATDIAFTMDGALLDYPLTGGLEAPQFAHFDLNEDEIPDLLLFDRVGSKVIPFEAVTTSSEVSYKYAPEYEAYFPPLYQLFQVADLNCDGKEDLISTVQYGLSAAQVYMIAHFQEGHLNFSDAQPFKLTGNPVDSLIRTHAFDIPALQDINGDGDIDLLYIPVGGTQIQYYENEGNCEGLSFQLMEECWGNAVYTLTADFELQGCGPQLAPVGAGCAGSVMLAKDYDLDGDMDLYFSGLYDREILQLNNGGDEFVADLVSQDISWVNYGAPMLVFPSPFFLDLYHDNQADLVVATNGIGGLGNSQDSDILYHFKEQEEVNTWSMQANDFLLNEIIDLGFRSSPAVWDVNQDGLLDILIGYNRPHPTFSHTARIAYFENVGTPGLPSFTLIDDDFANLSAYNFKSIHPTFGDINGDGLPELIIGQENGYLETFTNTIPGTDSYMALSPDPLNGIYLNGFAKPQLVDLSNDGLIDIVAGTRNSTISYIENTGTSTSPMFSLVTDTLAGIYQDAYFQECSAFIIPSESGAVDLYYGQHNGTIAKYHGNIQDGFTLQEEQVGTIDVGERMALTFADLNADGLPEILAGNMRGGLEIFSPEVVISADKETSFTTPSVHIYPNPNHSGTLFLELSTSHHPAVFELYNQAGQLVLERQLSDQSAVMQLDISHLPMGLYFYQVYDSHGKFAAGKLVCKSW